jgi:hypothetical protein
VPAWRSGGRVVTLQQPKGPKANLSYHARQWEADKATRNMCCCEAPQKIPITPIQVEPMSLLAMHPVAEIVRTAGPAQACQTPSGLSSHLPSVYDVILSASQGPRLMMQSTMGLFDPSYNRPPAHLISFSSQETHTACLPQ